MIRIIFIGLIVLAILAAVGAGAKKIYDSGIQAQKVADTTEAVKLGIQRDKLDDKLKTATPNDYCQRLGMREWVPDNGGECH